MKISGYIKKYWYMYAAGIIFLLLSSYLQTLSPGILGSIVDAFAVSEPQRQTVSRLIIWLLLAAVGGFITKFIWRYCLIGTARRLECGLREDLFAKLQSLSRTFYNSHKTGELMAYAINDINAVRMTFGPALAQLVSGVVTSALCIYNMLFYGNARLLIVTLVPICVALAAMMLLGTLVRIRFARVQKTFAEVSDRMQESIMGVRVIKAYAREEEHRQRFEELNIKMQKANLAMVRVSSLSGPVVSVFFGISFALSLVLGAGMVQRSEMSLGDFVAFQGYITSIVNPVLSIARIINIYQRGVASWKRLSEVFAQSREIFDEAPPCMHAVKPEGSISVHNLSFRYPGAQGDVLQDISFTVNKGETLGIIGRTGSGKTTLANLLVRLYDAPRGTIEFDGRDIRSYELALLRGSVGYVPQDGFLFSASIKDNLTIFAPPKSDEKTATAIESAALTETIASLGEGLDTMLGERGVNLSGGQQQRLSIARALMSDAPILLFDDAFSSVDTRTEGAILKGIRENYVGKTKIVIAHRVSAVRDAKLILVLEDGRIAEAGDHDTLMERGGIYAELYTKQSAEGDADGSEA